MESLLAARARSLAGIAPIDTEGQITLQDDAQAGKDGDEVLSGKKSSTKHLQEKRTTPSRRPLAPAVRARDSTHSARSLHPSESEDLTRAPTLPPSSTHTSHEMAYPDFDGLATKSPWKSPRAPRERKRPAAAAGASAADIAAQEAYAARNAWPEHPDHPTPDFGTLKRAMPGQGWAESRGADSTVSAVGGIAATWTDEDFLLLFPHLRYVRATSPDPSIAESAFAPGSRVLATPAQLAAAVAEVRTRLPELAHLHLATTWIKVRKWRELLGGGRSSSADGAPALATDIAGAPVLPVGFPANALHPRYVQSDVFMSAEEVSAMLLKESDLLYLMIEDVVVPRRQCKGADGYQASERPAAASSC